MKKRLLILVLAVMPMCAAGCGEKNVSETSAPAVNSTPSTGVSSSPASMDPAEAGSIAGVVSFEGVPPAPKELPMKGNPECSVMHPGGAALSEDILVKDGGLKNVFIYIKQGLEGRTFKTPETPVEMDNKNCLYTPHVIGAQVDQPVVFLNSDATLHNVHAYSKNSKSFNLGLPFQGMKQTKKFATEEVMVQMKCDVHPWMVGYIGVLKHPYFAVSDEAGRFSIKDLPPGDYVLEAWHEKLGVQSQTFKIEPREKKEINYTFKA